MCVFGIKNATYIAIVNEIDALANRLVVYNFVGIYSESQVWLFINE